MLLDAASDDLVDPDQIRRLLKELREVRMAKIRSGVDVWMLRPPAGAEWLSRVLGRWRLVSREDL